MKWYEAVAELYADPTKVFQANGWIWKLINGRLYAERPLSFMGFVQADISAEDQTKDWTLVIPPLKEYTFKEMLKELLKLGNKYYGQCTDRNIGIDHMWVTGYPNGDSSFLTSTCYDNRIFTDYITDETLRFHIKPKE